MKRLNLCICIGSVPFIMYDTRTCINIDLDGLQTPFTHLQRLRLFRGPALIPLHRGVVIIWSRARITFFSKTTRRIHLQYILPFWWFAKGSSCSRCVRYYGNTTCPPPLPHTPAASYYAPSIAILRVFLFLKTFQ